MIVIITAVIFLKSIVIVITINLKKVIEKV